MKLEDIHSCPESKGKIVAIEIDEEGNSYCSYCGEQVDYAPYFDEKLKSKDQKKWKKAYLRGKKIELKSAHVEAFKNSVDWITEDSVVKAMVTFSTIKHELADAWTDQCVDIKGDIHDNKSFRRIINPEKFDYEKVGKPGIYRDYMKYRGDGVEETYRIIVPYPFLAPELCEWYILKLNAKYNRNFKLEYDENGR